MVDWQYGSRNSAQTLGRVLDCEYPKEKYVVVGAQKGRILTPNQHKNKRKSSLNAWKPLQNPQISLKHTYVLHHVPRFIQKRRLTLFTIESCPDIVVRRGDMMRFLFNLWFKSELRSFWCTLYMDLWCRSMRWNFWFFNVESAPVHKFGPHL